MTNRLDTRTGGTGLIERKVTFTPESFDMLKEYQRERHGKTGAHLTNSEALADILQQWSRQRDRRA